MTVPSPRVGRGAGTKTTLTANDLLKEGGNTFSNIMHYQLLVSAPGVSVEATAGKSSYDIDGVELPAGTDRGTSTPSGRVQAAPASAEVITSIPTCTARLISPPALPTFLTAIMPSATRFHLCPNRRITSSAAINTAIFGYQGGYDSADRSFHNGITAAGGDDTRSGVVF